MIILVDQFRQPLWLNSTQAAYLQSTVVPNIFQRIRNKSYVFQQYFACANRCTPARATLLTGLYAPQTHMYAGEDSVSTPSLQTAFPTWGWAIQQSNLFGNNPSPYANNVWWFGKWHLSDAYPPVSKPLQAYGFSTKSYPGVNAPSPNGYPNEGTNGGQFPSGSGTTYASDSQIAADFTSWLGGATGPWCATVSFINPHDIALAPNWLNPSLIPSFPLTDPCNGITWPGPYFSPPNPDSPLPVFDSTSPYPKPWNYELPTQGCQGDNHHKPALQYAAYHSLSCSFGSANDNLTDLTLFLNNYYWLQNFVDLQVKAVLDAVANIPNTIVVFASDHGEYALSHGLHDKGSAVYDEGIRVPLYVQFPGQSYAADMEQMCSSVDFFGLICDLAVAASKNTGSWRGLYPSLGNRESIYNYMFGNGQQQGAESYRLVSSSWGGNDGVGPLAGQPYIMHTFDETKPSEDVNSVYMGQDGCTTVKSHIVCLRTKSQNSCPPAGFIGGKIAFYSAWAQCSTAPDGTGTDYEWEFYDYQYGGAGGAGNMAELDNDYYVAPTNLGNFQAALGTSFTSSTACALVDELNAPLQGNGTDDNPLTDAQCAAQQAYFAYMQWMDCQTCP